VAAQRAHDADLTEHQRSSLERVWGQGHVIALQAQKIPLDPERTSRYLGWHPWQRDRLSVGQARLLPHAGRQPVLPKRGLLLLQQASS